MIKKMSDRSHKSKEKIADSLMASYTTIVSTLAVTIFIAAITGIIATFFSRGDLPALTGAAFKMHKFNNLSMWVLCWTMFFYLPVLYLANVLKNRAMNIYDALPEKEMNETVMVNKEMENNEGQTQSPGTVTSYVPRSANQA